MRADALFDFPASMPFAPFFLPGETPWSWVGQIQRALASLEAEKRERHPKVPAGVFLGPAVFLHPTVRLPSHAVIEGPGWIGEGVEIRPNAYLRGNVIVGAGSVIGNASELKNCLLLEGVQVPHYNYVGDSVLGNRAHLGAGAICANLKLAQDEVSVVLADGSRHPTGMRKLGALLGDGAEAGCHCVLQPGSILGRGAAALGPQFHGYLPPGKLAAVRLTTRLIDRPKVG